jgi:V8-like Glu-specific endopeptidase
MTRYIAAVLLLVVAMSAQNAPSTNKGRRLDISAISREAHGAVVSIVMSDKKGHPIAQGSGFLISKDGRIVTNYHVIKSGNSAVIKLPDGAAFPVEGVLVSDKHRDVAIIKAHGSDFRALALGDSDRLQVGEGVVAIGSPLSLESTVSNGIVSGIRTVEEEGGKLLQITAPISPGSSGGPLFNMAGEVVGITTSHLVGGENLNFAIPINDVKSLTLVSRLAEARAFPDEAEDDKPTAVASTQNGPNLKDTVEFMDRMVAPDGRKLTAKGCSVTIVNTTLYTFVLADGKKLVRTPNGLEHYEFTWSVAKPPEAVAEFSLANIDPSSLKSFGVHSLEAVDRAHLTEHPENFKSSTDLWVVKLSTRDSHKSISATQVDTDKADSAGHVVGVDVNLTGLFVVFESKDRAERFVTALTHAVQLCGGRASDFAPTPTSK